MNIFKIFKRKKLIIKKTFSEHELFDIIIYFSDLPESYFYSTLKYCFEIKIKTRKNRQVALAFLQEALRKRFSSPERMKRNQKTIADYYIKNGIKILDE